MIGPAARQHFFKALHLAAEAERNLIPGQLIERAMVPLARSLIEVVRGIAFVLLSDDVEIRVKEQSSCCGSCEDKCGEG
jgi:hypothetical protein